MYKRIIIFVAIVACWFSCANEIYSQGIKLRSIIDSTHILIGDQLKLGFEVSQPKGVVVGFPLFSDSIVDKVEILVAFEKDTNWITNEEFVVKQEYLVTSFDSGFYYFPPFNFSLESEFIDDTIKSEPFYLQVFTLPVDTAKGIADIKDPYETPLVFKEVMPFVSYSLFGIIIIAVIIYILIKKKRNEPVFQRVKPKTPAHIVAFDDLDKLKQEKLWQQNKFKEYHSRLTEIVRVYIEDRFNINAMEFTTDETILAFKTVYDDKELILELQEMLTLADFVKFAKHIPLPDENDKSYQTGYDFVRKTKPMEEIIVPDINIQDGNKLSENSINEENQVLNHE